MAYDYRSHSEEENLPTPTQTNQRSYANATQGNIFPSKDQAIIIDSIEGTPIKDYINAVGSTFRNPFRFKNLKKPYLHVPMSKSTVTNLIEKNAKIKINNSFLTTTPYE